VETRFSAALDPFYILMRIVSDSIRLRWAESYYLVVKRELPQPVSLLRSSTTLHFVERPYYQTQLERYFDLQYIPRQCFVLWGIGGVG
jgi:hypothetical protein